MAWFVSEISVGYSKGHPHASQPWPEGLKLGLVPDLSLSSAAALCLAFDLSHDAMQIQGVVVVHGQHHRHV